MPRYFFTTNGDHHPPDGDGVVLAGPDEVRRTAIVVAGEHVLGQIQTET